MINTTEAAEIFEKAIDAWGEEAQLKMVAEECAELIQAVLKFGRKVNGANIGEVTDEMADVYMMLGQLEVLFKRHTDLNVNDLIDEAFQNKLERLKVIIPKPKGAGRKVE